MFFNCKAGPKHFNSPVLREIERVEGREEERERERERRGEREREREGEGER